MFFRLKCLAPLSCNSNDKLNEEEEGSSWEENEELFTNPRAAKATQDSQITPSEISSNLKLPIQTGSEFGSLATLGKK